VARNEQDWENLADLPVFSSTPNDVAVIEAQERAWKWLALLEREGKLRSIDVMRLGNLVEAAYDFGVAEGRNA